MKAATMIGVAIPEHDVDRELAERHAAGDPRAFDEVYSRYVTMVYNLAFRLAGDADEAADLTQEVFLRVFKHLGSFVGRSALKTWIFRVALNHCRERLARFRPPTQAIDDESGDAPGGARLADPHRDPEAQAVAADLGRRVARGLATLPVPFREAVVLRDLQGLSYQEIAAVLGVRVGTVRSRIARGREQLRAFLDPARAWQPAPAQGARCAHGADIADIADHADGAEATADTAHRAANRLAAPHAAHVAHAAHAAHAADTAGDDGLETEPR